MYYKKWLFLYLIHLCRNKGHRKWCNRNGSIISFCKQSKQSVFFCTVKKDDIWVLNFLHVLLDNAFLITYTFHLKFLDALKSEISKLLRLLIFISKIFPLKRSQYLKNALLNDQERVMDINNFLDFSLEFDLKILV